MGSEVENVIGNALHRWDNLMDHEQEPGDVPPLNRFILSSLEDAGFTVAKLERVGWNPKKPPYETSALFTYTDPKSSRYEPVYRIAHPTKEGE